MKKNYLLVLLGLVLTSCGQGISSIQSIVSTSSSSSYEESSSSSSSISSTLSTPTINVLFNGKELTSLDAGTFKNNELPTITYTVSPSHLASTYSFLKDGVSIGKTMPTEIGDYVYKVDVEGDQNYLSTSKSVTFSIEQGKVVGESKLDRYKIAYLSSSLNDEDAAAIEFRKSLSSLDYNLEIEALELYSNMNNYIYLDVNENLTPNTYKVSKDSNSFLLTSDSDVGLYEACRTFLSAVNTNDVEKISEWFVPSVEGTYSKAEPVKIMSYNVRVGNDGTLANGDSGNITNRAPRVLKGIKNYYPDVLGVQEANDTWVTQLKSGLMPQYGYTGWGREKSLTGESSGIFYNRDTVTLLETATKWLSDTPDVPGTKFTNAGDYLRILTYGIFERKSDGLIFMHINTHLDLTAVARILDVEVIQDYAEKYSSNMPIFVTGDMNNQRKDENDATNHLIKTYGYKDAADLDKSAKKLGTYPQEGYYSVNDNQTGYEPGTNGLIIDYCLFANDGFTVDKYEVDVNKYSGDGIEKPQLTSDHYPIYVEARPYNPLTPFIEYKHGEGEIAIDNRFCQYDHEFNLVKENSIYDKHYTVLASKSEHNGDVKAPATCRTKYEAVGGLSSKGEYVKYKFNSDSTTKSDLALVMSSSNYGTAQSPSNNYLTENLDQYIDLTINDVRVNLTNINLRNNDIKEWYDWEVLKLIGVDILEGENIVKITTKNNVGPNELLMEVFTEANITGDAIDRFDSKPTRFDETYHYYAANDGSGDEKRETHIETVVEKIVEPTTSSKGYTEKYACSVCGYVMKEPVELPELSDVAYDVDIVTQYIAGKGVCDTVIYTLKDTSIGEYQFTVITNSYSEYIQAGTSYYSIDRWNQLFPNQKATVIDGANGKELTIDLKENTITKITASDGVSPLDGMLNLLLYKKVSVIGKGTLDITYSTLQDGINANSFIVGEGATVNLTGASNANKSGIKVFKDLIIDGTLNISNFGYGQAIVYENSDKQALSTIVNETGELNITNCNNGLYAWGSSNVKKPTITNYGKIHIETLKNGMYFENADVNIYLRGNSETYISAGNGYAIYGFNGLYVGDGDKGVTQNNAKLTAIATGNNVIHTRTNNKSNIELVFNSIGTILIESLSSKIGINVAANSLKLFQISCADMTIKGASTAINSSVSQSISATYNYESPNAKLNLVNCTNIQSANGSATFSCFNEDSVNKS